MNFKRWSSFMTELCIWARDSFFWLNSMGPTYSRHSANSCRTGRRMNRTMNLGMRIPPPLSCFSWEKCSPETQMSSPSPPAMDHQPRDCGATRRDAKESKHAGLWARSDLNCLEPGLEPQTKVKNYFHTLEPKKEKAIQSNVCVTVSSISGQVRLLTCFYADG